MEAGSVIYVLKSAGLGGGTRVVLEHVSRLIQRGYNAKVYYLMDPPTWFSGPMSSVQFSSLEELKQALRAFKGIKVATWWETAYWIAETKNGEDRLYYLVQDIEDSYAVLPQHKETILNTYKIGLKTLVNAKWVQQQLVERFGQDPVLVSIGLNFDTFKYDPALNATKDHKRILTQCRTWSAGPNLKGWRTAKDTIEYCYETDTTISVITFGIEGKQQLQHSIPHLHFQGLTDNKLNELYNTSGAYLLSSNHEGFALTSAEAMLAKLPVVATYANGNEEYCINNKTALMAEPGDYRSLAKHIRYLFDNPDFANALATQAHTYIQQYTWDRCIDALEREFFLRPDPVVLSSSKEPPIVQSSIYGGIEYPSVPVLNGPHKFLASIIIPTVNTYTKVIDCVESIRRTTLKEDVEILVIDDGTQDDSIISNLFKASELLDFRLIRNYMNLGFSASVNRGILRAYNSKYVILCNNDVTFISDWLYPMVSLGDSDPDIGIVGAKLLYSNGTIQHAGMAKANHSLSFWHLNCTQPHDHPDAMITKPVWAVTGALFAIKREVLNKLGGLSTAYATAYEDVDYCLHAWRHGVKVYYCATASAVHLEGGTRGACDTQKSQKPALWADREIAGRNYFMKKWINIANITKPEELC